MQAASDLNVHPDPQRCMIGPCFTAPEAGPLTAHVAAGTRKMLRYRACLRPRLARLAILVRHGLSTSAHCCLHSFASCFATTPALHLLAARPGPHRLLGQQGDCWLSFSPYSIVYCEAPKTLIRLGSDGKATPCFLGAMLTSLV